MKPRAPRPESPPPTSLSQKSAASSFGGEDAGFLEALAAIPLTQSNDGSPNKTGNNSSPERRSDGGSAPRRKRLRFSSPTSPNLAKGVDVGLPAASPSPEKASEERAADYKQSATYDALRFGDFSTYMRNKRAKLKVQEAELKEQEDALLAAAAAATGASPSKINYDDALDGRTSSAAATIFAGCTIYITGHTNPPYAELRRLIVLHGGNFMAYLDQKKPVTHIIASNLTPKKRDEFRDYKVVRPEWVTQSISEGRKLAWHNFRVEADAGGAIGSERLPMGQAEATRDSSKSNAFLAAPQVGGQEQKQQGSYLANATPWGRAVAQKKLTSFATAASNKAPEMIRPTPPPPRPPSPPRHPVTAQVTSPLHIPPAGIVSPPPSTPPDPSSPVTASQEEWLATLETPPRPRPDTSSDLTLDTPSDSEFVTPPRPHPETPRKDIEAAVGTDPVSKSAAVAAGYFKSDHPYARRSSNATAARLMASPSWRERNTATSESFLSGYFAKSRLHYLSTWKGELKDLVSQALKDAGREDDHLQPLPKGAARVIMHIDFDSFFVSVGLRHRPDLKDKPVVVCHSGSHEGTSSTSEIASCNYAARAFGIHNGWSLGRARQLCPQVQPIPYDFEGYKDVSIQFYSLLLAHADAIEAVSVDEALVDVSRLLHGMRNGGQELDDDDDERKALLNAYRDHIGSQGERWTEEKQLAEALRDEIRHRTGCEASIGIGSNTLQARLATRHAKPGGSFHLEASALELFLAKLDIDDLQGVGYSTRHRFQTLFGTANIAELKRVATATQFMGELGPKLGKQVWDKMYGIDRAELEGTKQRQSVGAAVNYAIRFKSQEEAERFVRNLSEEVANRLTGYKLKGRQANVTIMVRDPAAPVEAPKFLGHGVCDVHNRSCALAGPGGGATNEEEHIFKAAWRLIKGLNADPRELRGIGISCTKLEPTEGVVVKPKPGQSVLNFARGSAPVTPSKLARQVVVGQEEEGDDEQEAAHPALTPGPSALRSQRQPSPPASPTRMYVEPAMPLPSLLDTPAKTTATPARSQSADPMFRPPQPATAAMPPAVARAPLSMHRLPTPFDRIAAKRTAARPAPAAPAPLGPALALPTMSQLDPSVLGELPPAIRDEVLRESRRMATTRSAAAAAAASTSTGMSRSLSASPSKRQLAATKGNSPSSQRLLQFPAIARNQQAPLRLDQQLQKKGKASNNTAVTAAAESASSAPAWAIDATKVTPTDLSALGIDAEVFAALPASVQRETLVAVRAKDARLVMGRRYQEITLAEERRNEAQKARGALDVDDEGRYLTAVSVGEREERDEEEAASSTVSGGSTPSSLLPSIQKRWRLEDVESLLTSWVKRYATRAPRPNDVARLLRFLTGSLSAESVPGSRMCDAEKVQRLMSCWMELINEEVRSQRGGEADAQAVRGWEEAWKAVKRDVDEAMRLRFGGRLKL